MPPQIARVTQEIVEGLLTRPNVTRVTQAVVEILTGPVYPMRATQVIVEILIIPGEGPIPPPPLPAGCPVAITPDPETGQACVVTNTFSSS